MEKELNIAVLQSMKIKELTDIALELEIPRYAGVKKQELIYKILEANAKKAGRIFSEGVLQVMNEGYGFLRSEELSYL
ncbi:MAG: Rho termination factor N-terminal domain-containing protein, partial [Candidatus Marinimicrobia bacterium]|nr:Rho termination factor N-terminal domain-containing protein [Candidatus Neomarinimicrobiota bacterium]